jgi:hypothetical protein
MKKQYQQPTTIAMAMEPCSILCASGGFINVNSDPLNGGVGA